MSDESVFPERAASLGTMYVEAEDKETLQKIDEITFTRAKNVLGVIYNSRSGNTKLKWRSVKGAMGRVSGEVSTNSIVNLFEAGVLDQSFVKRAAKGDFGPRKPRE